MTEPVSPPLAELAAAVGVATTYDDYLRRPVEVGAGAVRMALAAMGIDASSDIAAGDALAEVSAASNRSIPQTLVLRTGEKTPLLLGPTSTLIREDGEQQRLESRGAALALPRDLPTGYHQLVSEETGETSHVIVTPGRCPLPLAEPSFGWMAQLYAARSRQSWGIGDCRDLATLAAWSGEVGAAMILVNPLHATTPVLPQEASPYSPTSRRYRNPLYLRIEDIDEIRALGEHDARTVESLAEQARRANTTDRIDRDTVFELKMRALELLATAPRSAQREAAYRQWAAAEGEGLVDFATFCALSEQHGGGWQNWPAELRHPSSPAVAAARNELAPRVQFHMWLQWLIDEQLATAQAAATDAGMPIGIVHDLAVGVDPGGADAWALQDDLATGVTVGAPPDGFNQKGQDWGLPPLLPTRLPATGYAPFRDMIRSVLHHAGGIRIDHIMGLWRLWWVPQDGSAAEGTYVNYPARDLLGVLSLEAHRAGAVVVGEDLGTVQDGVREMMAEHNVLSSRVLYFERTDDDPEQPMLPAADYPELALTSVTTHDLPTAPGWWADEEIRVQTELDLFGESTTPAEQSDRKAGERRDLLDLLQREGLIDADASENELVLAMHRFLASTPSLLVATGLGDAVGDRRQPNMPGTVTEYPNWRLPVARWTAAGAEPVLIDEFVVDENVAAVAAALRKRGQTRPSGQ